MPRTIYYDTTTEEIVGTIARANSATDPAPSGQAKIEVADADWNEEAGHHCPGGVYTKRDYIVLSSDKSDTVTPYDGIPDCQANGAATHTITIQARNGSDDSNNTTRADLFHIEVISGACKLTALTATLVAGVKTFTVTSTVTGLVKLKVVDPTGIVGSAYIEIQFTP